MQIFWNYCFLTMFVCYGFRRVCAVQCPFILQVFIESWPCTRNCPRHYAENWKAHKKKYLPQWSSCLCAEINGKLINTLRVKEKDKKGRNTAFWSGERKWFFLFYKVGQIHDCKVINTWDLSKSLKEIKESVVHFTWEGPQGQGPTNPSRTDACLRNLETVGKLLLRVR